MSKRYYWLKLKDNFFNQKEIKRLRKIAGGDTYTIIYLKMLLISLKNDGKIYFDSIGDDFADEIALDVDEELENVQVTLSYLEQKNLIELISGDELEMTNIASMIGSESDSARRVRKHRKNTKTLQSNIKALQSNKDVTDRKHLGNTEIEKEKEKDTEKDYYHESSKKNDESISESENNSRSSNVFTFYQQNFGVINPFISENISKWIDDLSDELVIEAMKIALKGNKQFNYAEGILKDWYKNNIRTIEDVNAKEAQYKKKNNQSGRDFIPMNDRYNPEIDAF